MFSWNNKHLQLLKGHKRQMFIIYNDSIMSTTPHDLINNILIPVSLTKLAGPFHHRLFDLPINKIFISTTTGRQCSSSSHYYQCQNKYFVLIKAERAAAAATGIHPLQSHVRRRLPSMNAAPAADSQQFHFNHNYYFPMLL